MDTIEKADGVVLYSDGGSAPTNPGPAGYGIHGYFFSKDAPTRGLGLNGIQATMAGYRRKEAILSAAEAATGHSLAQVTVLKYVDIFGSIGKSETNNRAELNGAIKAYEFALKHKVTKVIMFIDSKYVVDGHNKYLDSWKRNKWQTQQGRVVANLADWQRLDHLRHEASAAGVSVIIDWIKGHADTTESIGNHLADTLATIATKRAAIFDLPEYSEKLTDTQGYWKSELEKHPLICHRRMYFTTQAENNENGVYLIGVHGSDDELFGTRAPDGAYGIVLLNKPDEMLENIRSSFCTPAGTIENIVALHLDTIYGAEFARDYTTFGDMAIDRLDENSANAKTLSRASKVATEFNPPMLAWRAMDALSKLRKEMQQNADQLLGMSKTPGTIIADITDVFYEKVQKKKTGEPETQLKPEFVVGYLSHTIEAEYDIENLPIGNGKEKLQLTLGLDLPDRNVLKSIQAKEPKVYLVTKVVSKDCYRYHTIVMTNDALGIYSSIYSNQRILLPGKVK